MTTHRNHAYEIARSLSLDSVDGLVAVSGDGLLHELLNGLLSRDDWQAASKLPVGIVPCGSGNGLARSVDTPDVPSAMLSIIKGHARPFDIVAVTQGERRYYSFLALFFGLIADVDIESENMRWLGAARMTVKAVQRLLKLRRPRARYECRPCAWARRSARRPDGRRACRHAIPGTGWRTCRSARRHRVRRTRMPSPASRFRPPIRATIR